MAEIILIAAVAANRVIGRDNQLIWNVPEDMAHFKALTAGHAVLMGRKTWESLPPRFRPLPGRQNIVITRQADFSAPGADLAHSLEAGLALAASAEKVFVIGGAEIYTQALPLADTLELTELDLSPEGDAWFPEFNTSPSANSWTCTARQPFTSSAGPTGSFVRYCRSGK
jgi:dihydrofolate reductase